MSRIRFTNTAKRLFDLRIHLGYRGQCAKCKKKSINMIFQFFKPYKEDVLICEECISSYAIKFTTVERTKWAENYKKANDKRKTNDSSTEKQADQAGCSDLSEESGREQDGQSDSQGIELLNEDRSESPAERLVS